MVESSSGRLRIRPLRSRSGRVSTDVLLISVGVGVLLLLFVAWFASRKIGEDRLRKDEVSHFASNHPTLLDLDVAVSGRICVSAGDDGALRVWDFTDGRLMESVVVGQSPVACVAISLDEKRLACGTEDGRLLVWDRDGKKAVSQVRAHDGPATEVAFHPSGVFAATGGADGFVRFWNADDGKRLHEYRHDGPVTACSLDPSGSLLLAASGTQLVLWSVGQESPLLTLNGHTASVQSVAFSRDGKTAASIDEAGTALLWDLETGSLIRPLETPADAGRGAVVALSPGGTRAIGAFDDGGVCLWYCGDGSIFKQFGLGEHGPTASVQFAPTGMLAVSAHRNGSIRVWSLPPPPGTELNAAKQAAEQLEQTVSHLDEFRQLMDRGKKLVDEKQREEAAQWFRRAQAIVSRHSHEYTVAEDALNSVRQADLYVAHMERGRTAMEAGKFREASTAFSAAIAAAPERTEARDAKKTADDLVEVETLLKEASKDLQFAFDSTVAAADQVAAAGSYVFALTSEKPHIGPTRSRAIWHFTIQARRPFPSTDLRCRLELVYKPSGKVVGHSEHAFTTGRTQEWVGAADAPSEGWTEGEYEFVTSIRFDDRSERFGEPAAFQMGLVEWTTASHNLQPRQIQQAGYILPTTVRLAKGDGLIVAAAGEAAPAPVSFYRKLLKDDKRRDKKPAGPEGLKQSLGNGNLSQYMLMSRELPFGAVLYRLNDGSEEIPWNFFAMPQIAERECTVDLTINSVQAIWSAGFRRIPTDDSTFWEPQSGGFDVQVCRARFHASFEIQELLKRYVMGQLAH